MIKAGRMGRDGASELQLVRVVSNETIMEWLVWSVFGEPPFGAFSLF